MKTHGILGGLMFLIMAACCASITCAEGEKSGELLYNGIRLSRQWPPQIEKLDDAPMQVPYLESPPNVIPIDVGRQLLPKSDTPGDWNWGNSQTACMSPLVVSDRLYFYVAGRAGLQYPGNTYQDAGGSTGVAFLRRDGFASMGANGQPGVLTTRPVRFQGKHPFVNVNTKEGSLLVAGGNS